MLAQGSVADCHLEVPSPFPLQLPPHLNRHFSIAFVFYYDKDAEMASMAALCLFIAPISKAISRPAIANLDEYISDCVQVGLEKASHTGSENASLQVLRECQVLAPNRPDR